MKCLFRYDTGVAMAGNDGVVTCANDCEEGHALCWMHRSAIREDHLRLAEMADCPECAMAAACATFAPASACPKHRPASAAGRIVS